MGMNNRIWYLALFLPLAAAAQQDSGSTPLALHRLTIEAYGGYDSNVLGNDLVLGLYRGGTISSGVRSRSFDRMGAANRGGYLLQGRATYAWGDSLFGRSNWMPRISLAYTGAMGMRFAKDAYSVAFFGNGPFEGSTAHLAPGKLFATTYQSFSMGVEDRNNGSYVELSVVNGQNFNAASVSKADLYTALDGRYLDLDLHGTYHRSDTAAMSYSLGLGAAINLAWCRTLQLFGASAKISLGVTDLGFIRWNGSTLSISKDSTIRYEGIEVQDILDLDNLVIDQASLQDSLGLGYRKGNFNTLLPFAAEGRLMLGKLRRAGHLPGLYAYEISAGQRYLPGYLPLVGVQRNFAFSSRLAGHAGLTYGGFGTWRATAGIDALVLDRFRLGIHAPNVIGLCSEQAPGKALSVRLEMAW